MRPHRDVLPVVLLVACFLGTCFLAQVARAGEDEGKEAKPTSEIWIFEKDGNRRDVDVTAMDAVLRKAFLIQMEAQGWKQRVKGASAAAKPPAPREAAPKKEGERSAKDSEQDIAELIRRGGKLPEGWRPHGVGPGPLGGGGPSVGPGVPIPGAGLGKALGKLILAYLDAQRDPARGPIYRGVLRDLAQGLAADGANPVAAVGRVMSKVMQGLQDPKQASVYREIMKILGDAMASGVRPAAVPRAPNPAPWGRFHGPGGPPQPPAAPRPGAPPTAPQAPQAPMEGPLAGAPTNLGGAPIGYVIHAGKAGITLYVIGPVPKESTAHAAGLRQGDRLVEIDGKPIDAAGLKKAAKAFTEGGQLTLELVRKDGKRETLSLLLEKE